MQTRQVSAARLLLALCGCLVVARIAAAQPPTGSLAGTVTGDGGNRLAGVVVVARGLETGVERSATTDANGHYEIASLPAEGEYHVRVAVSGFATSASEHVPLVVNGTVIVNFRLKLTVSESVAVSAPEQRAEIGLSTVQQTISEQLVHELPLAGRNFIPLTLLTAGFTGNPNFPSPQGQVFWTNNVIVDGASHFSKWRSAPRTFYSGYSLEAVKDVRVMTNRFSAEYGDALASVTSATTRSGGDELRGSALLFLQHGKLTATPVFSAINPQSDSERFGVTLGGPVAQSKTHFLASYEGRRSRGHNVVVTPTPAQSGELVPDDEDEHLIFLRADHRTSPQHLVSGRYNGQIFRWHNEPGGLTQPGTGSHYRNDVHTLLASDRQIRGAWLHDLRGQFARYVDVRTDLMPSVFVSRSGFSEEGGTLGPLGYGADPEDTWEAADTMSAARGLHSLRLGGGLKYVRAHNTALNYGRGAYFFAGPPTTSPQPFLFIQGLAATPESAQADPRSTSVFGFVQDDWRPRSDLTINVGARYDVEAVSNVRHYDAGVDGNNIQPRAGAAWEPFGSGRLVVRGGAGIYTQQHLLFYINRVQLEGADGVATLSLTPDSPLFPAFPNVLSTLPAVLPARDIHRVDPSFRNPYSFQGSIGAERSFRHLTVSADYVRLDGYDLMSLVDANAPASIQKPATRTVAQADATRPSPVRPGLFRNIVTLGNEGRSWYRALQVKAERASGALQTIASYTFARAEDLDNYLLPEDSRNLEAEKARASTDVTHNLSVGFSWQTPPGLRLVSGWTLSGVGIFRSGRPYTIVWGDDRNGTTQNDARPDGRNTARTDGYSTVDLGLARRIPAGAATIQARLEIFNVFNTTNFDQYVGSLLSPFYAKPVTAFPTRRAQLAAIVRF